MKKVKDHFEQEAQEFDKIIIKLIPYYEQMVRALIDIIPFQAADQMSVMDLGCGTGTISFHISKAFNNAHITCFDIAPNMIEMSKKKLSQHKKCEFIIGDFSDFDFDQNYDVIVSSLALHHLPTDQHKKNFYQKIYDTLNKQGLFINADVVLGSDKMIQATYMRRWTEQMKKKVCKDEIENKWLPKYYEEDHPSQLFKQLQWLQEIGFSSIDVIWKYYNYAVYCGKKI